MCSTCYFIAFSQFRHNVRLIVVPNLRSNDAQSTERSVPHGGRQQEPGRRGRTHLDPAPVRASGCGADRGAAHPCISGGNGADASRRPGANQQCVCWHAPGVCRGGFCRRSGGWRGRGCERRDRGACIEEDLVGQARGHRRRRSSSAVHRLRRGHHHACGRCGRWSSLLRAGLRRRLQRPG